MRTLKSTGTLKASQTNIQRDENKPNSALKALKSKIGGRKWNQLKSKIGGKK
jgi:hypothetical protein